MGELSFDLQRFAVFNYDNNVRVDGTTSADEIYIYGSKVTVDSGTGNDVIGDNGNSNKLNGGTGNDSIYLFSVSSGASVDAGTGNDYINSFAQGKHTLRGGTGNDYFYNSSLGTGAIIDGGTGNDVILNAADKVNITGGTGNDSIAVWGTANTVNAGTGNDTISGSSGGNLYLYNAGDGNDIITTWNANDTINITGDNYQRKNDGNDVVLTVGTGKITLKDAKSKTVKIVGTEGKSTSSDGNGGVITGGSQITNSSNNAKLTSGDTNDTIINSGSYVTISAGAGNDTINTDNSSYISINAGAGNDSVYCRSNRSTVNAGAGNDIVSNITYYSSVFGGEGNDSLYNYSFYSTINGGAGDDTITLYSSAGENIIDYTSGDGNDLIRGFKEKDSLRIGGGNGTYSTTTSASNVIVSVGNGKITLEGAKGKDYTILGKYVGETVNTKPVNITNSKNSVTLTGTIYNDTIDNTGSTVKVNTGGGDDIVTLRYGLETDSNKVTLDAGAGNDKIYAGGKYNSVNAGDGNDSIYVHGSYGTVLAGAGKDTISGNNGNMKLFGNEDNDLISITSYWSNTISSGGGVDTIAVEGGGKHSIAGGADADRISLGSATNSTIFYASGDGNDTVWNFNSTDMLNISGSYSTAKSGSDISVKVGSGSILLKDATKIGSININGKTITVGKEETVTQQDVIKNFMASLDKSTSTNATTLMDNAVKTASNGKFATIQKAIDAMVKDCQYSASGTEFLRNYCGIILDNDDTGAISGYDAGGKLKTAKSVIPESGTKYSLDTSKYGGYYVWYDNKDSGLNIRYTDVGNVTKDKQHIMDCAYSWWSSEAVKLINESYGYNFSDSNAKYKKVYLTFSQSGDYLAYTGQYRDGLEINVNLEYFNSFKSNDYDGTSPNGQGYLDRTFTHETVHAVMMSKLGNKFWNLPQFFTEGIAELIHGIDDKRTWNINQLATDADYLKTKLSMTSGTGDSPTYAAGYMLLRYIAKQSATTNNSSAASAVTSTQKKIPTGVTTKDTTMTISAKFTGKSINMSDYAANLTKADASAVTKAINIFGNKNNNMIIGGKGADYLAGGAGNDTLSGGAGADILSGGTGNDSLNGGAGNDSLYSGTGTNTLTGGAGSDRFFYEGGNLTITDYEAGEKIKISGDKISKSTVTGGNVVFTTGKGSITLTGGAGKTVTLIDKDDKVSSKVYGKASGGESSTSTTLKVTNSTPSPVTVDASVKTINASGRTTAVKITGNDLANTISGGSKNDSLYGGAGADSILGNAGNDKIWGDAGNDILRGGDGNDSLAGGAGNDSLWGDAGNDKFFYSDGGGKDVIFGFETGDLLQITGKFSGTYNKSKKEIAFKVGSTTDAITLKNFTATTFNINGDSYGISGTKLMRNT